MSFSQYRTVLVTGGSCGIGAAIVEALGAEGMRVINADVREGISEGQQVHYRYCDVSRGDEVDGLFRFVTETYGVPEVLLLNAGVGVHEKLTEGDPAKWQQVLDTNVMGALRMIRAFVPAMLERGAGHIVFLSSISAGMPYAYGGVYAASKAALETIAATLRVEVGKQLRVSIVSPGLTATGFFQHELQGGRSLTDFPGGALDATAVAAQVMHVLRQPNGIVIDNIVIRPKTQLLH